MTGSRLALARSKRTSQPAQPSGTNADLVSAWSDAEKVKLQGVTFRSYGFRIRLFLDFIGEEPLGAIKRADLWDYIDTELRQGPRGCSWYQSKGIGIHSSRPFCLKGLDIPTHCSPQCAQRRPVLQETIEHHLYPIVSLYDYLYRHDLVETNVAARVLDELMQQTNRTQPKQKYRRITTEEVEVLLRATRPPHLKTAFAILALTGVRCGEMQRLRASPQFFNLEEGWIEVPHVPKQKRVGESRLWMTDELVGWLETYMPWREKRIKRDAAGNPLHDGLVITARGTHWASYDTFHPAWHKALERAGILKGDEDEFNTLTPHDMRHWLTTELRRAKAPDYFVALYRGDKRGVIADEYTHFTDEQKRREFLHYAPRIKF